MCVCLCRKCLEIPQFAGIVICFALTDNEPVLISLPPISDRYYMFPLISFTFILCIYLFKLILFECLCFLAKRSVSFGGSCHSFFRHVRLCASRYLLCRVVCVFNFIYLFILFIDFWLLFFALFATDLKFLCHFFTNLHISP